MSSASSSTPANNVTQSQLSPPVHNFVFLVTFVFLAVWLVKAFFRARHVLKLYSAVSRHNVVRINDAHPHHMRQADVMAVVRNRATHTMHVVDAVRLRFHLSDQSVKIVPNPKDENTFLLRFQVHVDPATCANVAVDVFGGVSMSAVREFFKLFAGNNAAALNKAAAKKREKKEKRDKEKLKEKEKESKRPDAAAAPAAGVTAVGVASQRGTVIAVAPKRGSNAGAGDANTTTGGTDTLENVAALTNAPLSVLARSKLELVTFQKSKLWGRLPTLTVKSGLKQDVELKLPKDWFATIGTTHATKYPLVIRITDIDAPPSAPAPAPAAAAVLGVAAGTVRGGGVPLDQKEGDAKQKADSVTAGASFSASNVSESANGSSVSVSASTAGPAHATVPVYGVELTILQLTTRPGEYAPQLARARASVAAAAAARAANPPAAPAPAPAAIEMQPVGAGAGAAAAAGAPATGAPGAAAAGAAPAPAGGDAAAGAAAPASAAAAAAAGGALVIVERPELEKLLGDAKVDQQIIFTDSCFLTCLDIYGLDEESSDCIACLTEPKDIILLPCRHVSVCHTCFENVKVCPICRAPILNHMQFMSAPQIAAAEARLAHANGHGPAPKTPPVLHPSGIALEVGADEKQNGATAVAAAAAMVAPQGAGNAAHPLHNPNVIDQFPPAPQPQPPGEAAAAPASAMPSDALTPAGPQADVKSPAS